MARNNGRSSPPGNNSSLILGILLGMVFGLLIAGGVAWHLSKRPSAFVNKEQHEPAPSAAPANTGAKPAAPKPVAPLVQPAGTQPASAVGSDGKPRFQFYQILSDDKEKAAPRNASRTQAPAGAPKEAAKEAGKETAHAPAASYYLQAGSFSSADEADKLKARLALAGLEASVQSAAVSGKGTYYRVRLGPYRSADEVNKANNSLKQNGINDAAQLRGQ